MKAMYIGSFDPFTLGHLSIVDKALVKYDELLICIGKNDAKTPMFTAEERKRFIELAVADHPRAKDISVITSDELTVDIARRNNVNFLIRGVRSELDMLSEEPLAETNRFFAAQQGFELKTVFVTQEDAFLKTVSSSLVRTLLKMKKYTAAARCLPSGIAQTIIAAELKDMFCKTFITPHWAEKLWKDVVKAYSARPYHNFVHLAYMFDMLNLYLEKQQFFPRRPEMNLAILMHDIVYKPNKNQTSPYHNEEASAALAREWIERYNCKNIWTTAVLELIMATTHDDAYLIDDHWQCTQLIADLDLSILGTADAVTWKQYCDGIRKEYAAFSDKQYKQGRLKFLSALLEKEHIFHTAFFREMLEKQARINIADEIRRLQNNT